MVGEEDSSREIDRIDEHKSKACTEGFAVRRGNFFHSSPFVLGNISRIRSSLLHAPRMARANALKMASIL